ncbi:uncharacterized protein [Patagioenas fasciata]|uniref:uncharacterized protein n=1 Tax=Patagioenas fasciata TaxID=372321 RepID=UPI003A9A43AE
MAGTTASPIQDRDMKLSTANLRLHGNRVCFKDQPVPIEEQTLQTVSQVVTNVTFETKTVKSSNSFAHTHVLHEQQKPGFQTFSWSPPPQDPPRHPESRHQALLPVARLLLSSAAAAPAGTGKARGNQPLPALQRELRARAEFTGAGLARRTRFPSANRPLPRLRIGPQDGGRAARGTGVRAGLTRGRAGQGRAGGASSSSSSAAGGSRPHVPSAPRHVTGVTPPAPPAPRLRADFPLSLSLPPVRPTGEGSRAVPACAAAASVAPTAARPCPPHFLTGNSRRRSSSASGRAGGAGQERAAVGGQRASGRPLGGKGGARAGASAPCAVMAAQRLTAPGKPTLRWRGEGAGQRGAEAALAAHPVEPKSLPPGGSFFTPGELPPPRL